MKTETRHPETRSTRRSRGAKLVALVGVVALAASACTSDPSAKRVAQDLVNTLLAADEDKEQRECMLEKIDGYTKDELEDISKNADEAAATQNVGEISDIQKFQNDLESCN